MVVIKLSYALAFNSPGKTHLKFMFFFNEEDIVNNKKACSLCFLFILVSFFRPFSILSRLISWYKVL